MNSEKAVVITGASGFIGSNVAKLFVDSGFTVINIDKKKRELEGVTQYPFEIDNVKEFILFARCSGGFSIC